MNKINDLPLEVNILERKASKTSKDIILPKGLNNQSINKLNPIFSLYYGIENDPNYEKLEIIFQNKMISKNNDSYISLLPFDDDLNYDFYIKENISILVSPEVNAIETKYVSYNTWNRVKDKNTKNIYSYIQNEFASTKDIPYELFLAIGFPYLYYMKAKGSDYAIDHFEYLTYLKEKYEIDLPIVDTSNRNSFIDSNYPTLKLTKMKQTKGH